MNETQTRAAIIAYFEDALKFAEDLEDGATAYLIGRALCQARAKQFSNVAEQEQKVHFVSYAPLTCVTRFRTLR